MTVRIRRIRSLGQSKEGGCGMSRSSLSGGCVKIQGVRNVWRRRGLSGTWREIRWEVGSRFLSRVSRSFWWLLEGKR